MNNVLADRCYKKFKSSPYTPGTASMREYEEHRSADPDVSAKGDIQVCRFLRWGDAWCA